MHKLFLWAALITAVLTTNTSCTNQGNADELNVFQINVGNANGSLKYYPEDPPTLPPGTIVQFNFLPKNHTVTESSFAEPCKPLAANLTRADRPGLKTGFVPVTGNESFTPAFRIRINDTKPIWLYCGQGKHCQLGMVMVINQNKSDTVDKTLLKYREKAALFGASSSAAPSAASSAPVVTPVSSTPSPTSAPGPALASSTTTGATPLVSVFNGGAAPTGRPGRFAAVGGLAMVGAVVLL